MPPAPGDHPGRGGGGARKFAGVSSGGPRARASRAADPAPPERAPAQQAREPGAARMHYWPLDLVGASAPRDLPRLQLDLEGLPPGPLRLLGVEQSQRRCSPRGCRGAPPRVRGRAGPAAIGAGDAAPGYGQAGGGGGGAGPAGAGGGAAAQAAGERRRRLLRAETGRGPSGAGRIPAAARPGPRAGNKGARAPVGRTPAAPALRDFGQAPRQGTARAPPAVRQPGPRPRGGLRAAPDTAWLPRPVPSRAAASRRPGRLSRAHRRLPSPPSRTGPAAAAPSEAR